MFSKYKGLADSRVKRPPVGVWVGSTLGAAASKGAGQVCHRLGRQEVSRYEIRQPPLPGHIFWEN